MISHQITRNAQNKYCIFALFFTLPQPHICLAKFFAFSNLLFFLFIFIYYNHWHYTCITKLGSEIHRLKGDKPCQ